MYFLLCSDRCFLFTEFYEKIIEFYESVVGKQNYGTVKNCIVATRSGEYTMYSVYVHILYLSEPYLYTIQPKVYFPQQTIIPEIIFNGGGRKHISFSQLVGKGIFHGIMNMWFLILRSMAGFVSIVKTYPLPNFKGPKGSSQNLTVSRAYKLEVFSSSQLDRNDARVHDMKLKLI